MKIESIIEYVVLKDFMDEHRKEVVITCKEDCLCWAIEIMVNEYELLEQKKRLGNVKLVRNEE